MRSRLCESSHIGSLAQAIDNRVWMSQQRGWVEQRSRWRSRASARGRGQRLSVYTIDDQAWISQQHGWVEHKVEMAVDSARPGHAAPGSGRWHWREVIVTTPDLDHE